MGWLRSVEKWGWCVLFLSFMGCSPAQPDAPFYRFVEDVDPGDRWRETKVRIGNETRNVLSALYRSGMREIEIGPHGTVAVGAVADLEKVSADATGITIEIKEIQTSDQSGERAAQSVVYGVYVPLPSERDLAKLAGMNVRVMPAAAGPRAVRARAREVVPLPQVYRTKPVRVPRSARLDFGIGIEEEEGGSWSLNLQFTVEAEHGQQRRTIFSRMLDPQSDDAGSGWVDAGLDVSDLAGSTVRFVFRIESVSGEGQEAGNDAAPLFNWSPVWSSPILHSTAPRKRGARPNLVLISLDTLRADHLGCYGYHRSTSPNIDEFAKGAVLFEYAIAPSPWTTPSHASVFTGLHPSVHGAGRYIDKDPYYDYPIEQREITLAELARQHGYLTAAYTEGAYVGAVLGFSQGFDAYSDRRARVSACAEETFGNAVQWLEKYGHLPFVLFVHTYETHTPYAPPRRFVEMFDKGYRGTAGAWPEEAQSEADRIHCEACYDGEIAYTDEVVREFLAKLKKTDILQDTVIILFSDHGEGFWEHGRAGHGHTLYEEVLRVPLIIKLAGEQPPTGRVTRQVSLTDLYATSIEILGIDHESPLDCISLVPLIDGNKSRGQYERDVIVSELTRRDKDNQSGELWKWRMHSVRRDDEKCIIAERDQTEELYDLGADPGEKNNIAAESRQRLHHYSEVRERFLATVAGGRTPTAPTEPTAPPVTEEDRRQFKALGYL